MTNSTTSLDELFPTAMLDLAEAVNKFKFLVKPKSHAPIEKYSSHCATLLKEGLFLIRAGNFDGALNVFLKMKEVCPEDERVTEVIARLYEVMDEMTMASTTTFKGVDFEPIPASCSQDELQTFRASAIQAQSQLQAQYQEIHQLRKQFESRKNG